jgi:hypothetical protein
VEYTATTDITGWAHKIECIEYNITYLNGYYQTVYYTPYTIHAVYNAESHAIVTNVSANSVIVLKLENINLPPDVIELGYKAVYTHSAILEWTECAAPDFKVYELHMSTEPNFIVNETTRRAAFNLKMQTIYNVTGLVDNTQYWFKIKVIDTFGLSSISNEICIKTLNGVPPAVRVAVPSAVNITAESVIVEWSRAVCTDFGKYTLIWSTAFNFIINQSVTILDINHTSYYVTNLSEYTVYYFKVRVFDNALLYSDSNIIAVRTDVKNSKPTVTVSIIPPTRPYYITTSIRWIALYKDVDNDIPESGDAFINLIINGNESYPMIEVDPQDRDATDGKEYYCELHLPAGRHTYWVAVDDGAAIPKGLKREIYCRASTSPITIIVEDVKALQIHDMLYFALLVGILVALVVIIKMLATLIRSEKARAKIKKHIESMKRKLRFGGREKGVIADRYRLK